ncbi:hypothetical protein DFH09DRAFT_1029581 [Mycena vulgaris]|nr:hypothetical protein DFH09DRAFT_1029581 [Mycena vulgaris]
MSSVRYTSAFGIHSVTAVAIFAALYFPLGVWFGRQSIKKTTYVYIILALFCAMRITAYTIRAIIATSSDQASDLSLFFFDQVLLGVGFFALLYSAYTLVLDRDQIATGDEPAGLNLLRSSYLFRIFLVADLALGIVATIDSTSSDLREISIGRTLRKTGTIIFFVLTIVQAMQNACFFKNKNYSKGSTRPFGDRHGQYLLWLISLLMLVREVFLTATLNDSSDQNDERLWYPLVALPEFLAVVCYSILGLVPTRVAMQDAQHV